MHIDKNSYGTIALVYLISIVVVAGLYFINAPVWLFAPVAAFALFFCVWQTYFFRVPSRIRAGSHNIVSSVADGKVVIIDKVFEPEFLNKECIQVSVYMNFWDVHANFWPIDGEVTYSAYHPGKHLLAFKPKASEENEHTCVCVRNKDGKDVYYKQLAGYFARRIVSYAKPGMPTKAGSQCGIIKFGSRLDILLPLDAEIKVRLGEKVRASETVIATI